MRADQSQARKSFIQPLAWRPDARIRLFCFPFAGGGMSAFNSWGAVLGVTTELWGVQMPGREDRLLDPPLTRVRDALDVLVPAMLPCLDRPFAFFGHSMGAILCVELARALQRMNAPRPRHVFVSACQPLHRREVSEPYLHELPDDALVDELRRMDGTPEQVLASPELMALLLPTFRADLALIETYHYLPGPALACPLSAFGGVEDPEVSPEDLAGWAELTTGAFDAQVFRGGHFYITANRDALLEGIERRLSPSRPDPGRQRP
jgi:medium-chain acyl-[acyl-carrier-protein] hydrolase